MKFTVFVLTALVFAKIALAQSPLERRVSVRLDNARLTDALSDVARKADFNFSYASTLFNGEQRVDLIVTNIPVRQVLDQLFRGSLRYKVRGSYVILRKAEPEEKPRYFVVTGTVTDLRSGERLAGVSVYERQSLTATLTDGTGAFRLRLPAAISRPELRVVKQAYEPRRLALRPGDDLPRRVALIPLPPPPRSLPERLEPLTARAPIDSVPVQAPGFETATLLKVLVPAEQRALAENLNDTIRRPFQISFLPYLGTNHRLSGSVVNSVSVNVLAGYSGGVNGFEVSGLANLVRGSVTGGQVAGLVNLVQGPVRGLQVAGLSNQNFADSRGTQVAGLFNNNWENSEGVHVAGLVNFTRKNLRAVQVSGFVNAVSGRMKGAQVAGFANANLGSNEGFQLAGFANFNRLANRGAQVSGYANVTLGDNAGLQLSGAVNVTLGTQRGWQVGGLFNFARIVTGGRQLAFFNYADSSSQAPIGLLSYVRRGGYHHLEASADEVFPFNFTFRTGKRSFYTLISTGVNPFASDNLLYRIGLGLGRSWRLDRARRWWLNTELVSYGIAEDRFEEFSVDLLKLNLLVEREFGRHWALAFGPTFNAYTIDIENPRYSSTFAGLIPYRLSRDFDLGLTETTTWVGFHAGLRWRW
ncbi:MAG: hypothetical protein H7Y12_14565 [Sphingobacteriaceae bacterium]|nr:hypothetical protein [Cytophagaceae bacterium]